MELTIAEIAIRLVLAMVLGSILGTERVFAHKTAGIRTYALVSMGSALFVIISQVVSNSYLSQGFTNFDMLRMAAQVVVGIGFLGAGLIIFRGSRVTGLTTASGLWVAAGIGMAVGFGLYGAAIVAAVLTLFIFIILWFIENKLKKTKPYEKTDLECSECGREIEK
ncbi:MAG: MgtC/SapB family protein [Candidatus Marinimicrobia bacterium]|nr:MgtC/SapB family protein [Candidatus Neomarinimicrobiota bacterium]